MGVEISTRLIKFPLAEASLPEGFDHLSSITLPEMIAAFNKAISLLQQLLEQLLEECHPKCLVADSIFPLATDVANKLKIPRLVFHGTSCFVISVFDSLENEKTGFHGT